MQATPTVVGNPMCPVNITGSPPRSWGNFWLCFTMAQIFDSCQYYLKSLSLSPGSVQTEGNPALEGALDFGNEHAPQRVKHQAPFPDLSLPILQDYISTISEQC
jgi:hypothetical protein